MPSVYSLVDHQLGRLVSESAFERKDPGSNPAADMVDAARNTAWDLVDERSCVMFIRCVVLVLASFCLSGCSGQSNQGAPMEILITAKAEGLSDLLLWLNISGLDSVLSQEGPFTLFAPTNSAFSSLPPTVVWKLKSDDGFLRSVLQYHVIQGNESVVDLASQGKVTSVQGEDIEIFVGNDSSGRSQLKVRQKIADATVVLPNLPSSNGIIHIVDRVLLPPSLQTEPNLEDLLKKEGNLNTFLSLVETAGMLDVLREGGPLTLFAPTDEAFQAVDPSIMRQLTREARLLKAVILSHIVDKDLSSFDLRTKTVELNSLGELIVFRVVGSAVLVNTARVIKEDLVAQNGAMHVISGLLLPSILALGSQGPPSRSSLYDKLAMSGLTLYQGLVKKSGISLAFQNGDPLTIFAPSNKAMSLLPREEVRKITEDIDHLRKVVMRHAVLEKVATSDFVPDDLKSNMAGEQTRLNVYKRYRAGDVFTVNGVPLSVLDERGKNGVLHVIDGVIPASNRSILELLQADLRFSTFLSALQASDLISTLNSEGPVTVLAPTAEAFAALPDDVLFSALQDVGLLTDRVSTHIITRDGTNQTLFSSGICWTSFSSVNNVTLRSGVDSEGSILVSAGKDRVTKVTEGDIVATNGVIHVVDTIL
ncbi:FAS1 domain [Trinorchestia longiramus]|nr:FAS1 domain [Trinorchestia longiramus]